MDSIVMIILGGFKGQSAKQLSYVGSLLHWAEGRPFLVFKFPISQSIL